MWPFFRRPRRRRSRQLYLPLKAVRRSGLRLFAFALSCALLFQACGGSEELSGTADSGSISGSGAGVEAVDTGDEGMDTLSKEHQGDKPTPTPIAVAEPAMPVTGEAITYATIDGEAITGYLAQPQDAEAGLSAVIAIHEWWGLNENIEAMARRIAGEGYTVLAVDLYDNEVASDPTVAKELLRSVMDNPGPAQENLSQAAQFLKEEYGAPKLGVIGWCFGGSWSLRAGLLLKDLNAVVIYYGQLILAPEALDGLEAPVLAFFGEDDSSIPVEDVENFEEILTGLGKPADINLYAGVGHAFANPSGQNYDAAAAEEAWGATTAFFESQLGA